jgi:motility quorum-sensing regulator/GCU-specific mRNA interferase toxin
MEKRRPHYSLADIKAAFADPATLNRSFVSKQGADALKMDGEAVIAVIQALKRADFVKSMTSYVSNQIWQDVYGPMLGGTKLYVKFTIDAMGALFSDQLQGGIASGEESEELSGHHGQPGKRAADVSWREVGIC